MKEVFYKDFISFTIKWGKGLNFIGIILAFFPCIMLYLMGIHPTFEAFFAGIAIQLPLVISPYIYEPLSYFAVLGIPGTYMSFLSGNIANLRVPASSIAQAAAKVEEGSEEGTVISTIGIAISIIVNIIILTVGIFVGAKLIPLLPGKFIKILNLLLPALFAALLANFSLKNMGLAKISIILSLVVVLLQKKGFFRFFPNTLASALPILICVFATMFIGIQMAKGQFKKEIE